MKKIIEKANVLIEALPYIQRFRDEIIVVKLGGSAMEDKAHTEGVLTDITFMECVGMLPVIVHGGGKAITRGMKDSGIEAKFVKGLRVTCDKTIEIVRDVLNTQINPEIVSVLESLGGRGKGLFGEEIFTAVRKTATDEKNGATIDWGFVGDPVAVDTGPVRALLDQKIVPVITPLGKGPDGKIYNMNADTAAAMLAKALKARKLAFLSDVPGLLSVPADPESIIPTLKAGEVEELVDRGVIDGGMLPKIKSAVDALQAGVRKIHLIDGRMSHSLLLEIFTDKGVGTEIVRDE